jgi:ribonuclease P protein component
VPAHRFGKDDRVRRREDFQRAFDTGVRVGARYFTLLAAPRSGSSVRLGIVASRKLGDAVRRNRAKRLIREIFRQFQPLAGGSGIDLIVIPRRELFEAGFSALEKDFRAAWRRAAARLPARNVG